ncbi:hypothetical protein TNCV_1452411 [Trichonephila clavipes]|nr:hypothetical protein TNCV_1452411 [Trichonephila clavipes]
MGKGLLCIGLIRPDWFLRLFVASSRCRSGLTGLVITSTNFHSGSTCSRSAVLRSGNFDGPVMDSTPGEEGPSNLGINLPPDSYPQHLRNVFEVNQIVHFDETSLLLRL